MCAFQLSIQSSARSEVYFRWLSVVEMDFSPLIFLNNILPSLVCPQTTPLWVLSSSPGPALILLTAIYTPRCQITHKKQFLPEGSRWESQWTYKNSCWEVLWKPTWHQALSSQPAECLKANQHMVST